MIFSQDLEMQVLGGILNTPEFFMDNQQLIGNMDFYFPINQTIFGVMSRAIHQKEPIDKIILINKMNNLKMAFEDGVEISSYVDTVSSFKPSSKIFKKTLKELKLLTMRRVYAETGKKITQKMMKAGDMDFEKIQGFVDENLNKSTSSFMNEDDTIDLFSGMYDLIEERGNNPVEEIGFKTPFPEFNKSFGGCKIGDVYVWCARPGSGKSTLLNNMAFSMSNLGDTKIPALIIDTEMGQEDAVDVKFRLAASISGINPWYFTTGNWRKDPEMVKIVRSSNFKSDLNSYKLYYEFIPNANKAALLSTIKRWYYTKVGRGNPCIVVYDYIKFSGGDGGDGQDKEFQAIGEKVNALKELMGKEVRGPLLTAVQMNRQGETRSKNRSDDSSAIAISDRILWFATYVGIFRKKDINEIAEEGKEFGTHKMITLKTRFQGQQGYDEYVKTHTGEIKYNFANYNVKNFKVSEVCSAEKMYSTLDTKPKEKDKGRNESESDGSSVL